nr:3-deoxy-d-arabino-heptulosonate-7-phosphate [Catharanthus roseus]
MLRSLPRHLFLQRQQLKRRLSLLNGVWESWKSKKALQLPEYPDEGKLDGVLKTIEAFPPLVFAGEARSLEEKLAQAAMGNAFLLQGGDCAESFKELMPLYSRYFQNTASDECRLTFGGQCPVIKVGRMAGQFAKPRLDPFEEKDGLWLSGANGWPVAWEAYCKLQQLSPSRALLLVVCCYAESHPMDLDFVEHSEQGDRYQELAHRVDEALGFMDACGLTVDHPIMATTEFWTSHECLLLPYEQALTREDSTSGLFYDCSAHMLWVGERTRQLDGAHVEFLRGVANPLGIKVSQKMDPNELVNLIEILNPTNKPGRITVIVRMGAENMRVKLPHLIRAVRGAGQIVTWVCDPMHGNTIKAPCGLKTRAFDAILAEVRAFYDVHEQEGTLPGTECVGGSRTITYDDRQTRYHTHCDPRLNASQSLELAFIIAERLRKEESVLNAHSP